MAIVTFAYSDTLARDKRCHSRRAHLYYKINFLITVTSNKHCTKRQTENRDEGENRDELNFKTLALYRVRHEVADLGLVGKQVLTMCRRK